MKPYESLFDINKSIINIACVLLRLKRFPNTISNSKTLKKNIELKKLKKTKNCFVLGLGPSLKDADLTDVQEDIIVVNTFYKFDRDRKIHPKYYCIIDTAFYIGSNEDKNMLIDAYRAYPDTIFILNGKYKLEAEKLIGKRNNVYYVIGWKGTLNKKSNLNFTKNLPLATNVVCRAIELAIFLNYSSIYLLGCDFNSFANEKEAHCYKEENDTKLISRSFELFCYSFSADEHYQLNRIAKEKGIKIYNLTPGSLLDAYTKK